MMIPFILCADDFGQDASISKAILTLAQKERLSAVSCMTTCPDWVHYGPLLDEFEGHLDVGLHFNLTHGHDSRFRLVSTWTRRSLSFSINKTAIRDCLHQQLDSFEKVLKREPDFIDGHQHVHVFPGIRDVLIEVVEERYPRKKPSVRSISPLLSAPDSVFKSWILKGMSLGFSRALDQHKLRHNPLFAGVYSLTPEAPYRAFFKQWLACAQPYTLIMCHPGENTKFLLSDPICAARTKEYAYLLSDDFLQDCADAQVCLSRFKAS